MHPFTHPNKSILVPVAAEGWKGLVRMGKVSLPVSFGTFLLDFSGEKPVGGFDGVFEGPVEMNGGTSRWMPWFFNALADP